jgi:hypothetical protein
MVDIAKQYASLKEANADIERLGLKRGVASKALKELQGSRDQTAIDKAQKALDDADAEWRQAREEAAAIRNKRDKPTGLPEKVAPTAGDPLKKAEEKEEPESKTVIDEKERTRLSNLYDSLKEAGQIEAGVTKEDFINSGGDRKPPSAYKTDKVKSLLE